MKDMIGLFLDTVGIFQITGKEIFFRAVIRIIQRSSGHFKIRGHYGGGWTWDRKKIKGGLWVLYRL